MNILSMLNIQMMRPMLPMGGMGGMGAFGQSAGGGLAGLFGGLATAFQGLADLIGGLQGNGQGGASGNPAGGVAAPGAKPIAGTARIWGDPHFIGADGGKFDVQGEAGKTYNLLSDKGFQMNGRFDKWGGDPRQTVVGEVGISAGSNYISVSKNGTATVNGQALKDGQRVALRDGGYAEKRGNDIVVKKGEWEVNFQTRGDHINMDIKTDNAIADGVKPHGLIGQTFDGDGKARNGDRYMGAQGGGAIEDANGNIARAGDKDAVKSYEVDTLWDTTFGSHNRDYAGQSAYAEAAAPMQMVMMSSFTTLSNSLFGNQNQWGWGGGDANPYLF